MLWKEKKKLCFDKKHSESIESAHRFYNKKLISRVIEQLRLVLSIKKQENNISKLLLLKYQKTLIQKALHAWKCYIKLKEKYSEQKDDAKSYYHQVLVRHCFLYWLGLKGFKILNKEKIELSKQAEIYRIKQTAWRKMVSVYCSMMYERKQIEVAESACELLLKKRALVSWYKFASKSALIKYEGYMLHKKIQLNVVYNAFHKWKLFRESKKICKQNEMKAIIHNKRRVERRALSCVMKQISKIKAYQEKLKVFNPNLRMIRHHFDILRLLFLFKMQKREEKRMSLQFYNLKLLKSCFVSWKLVNQVRYNRFSSSLLEFQTFQKSLCLYMGLKTIVLRYKQSFFSRGRHETRLDMFFKKWKSKFYHLSALKVREYSLFDCRMSRLRSTMKESHLKDSKSCILH
jgi:hypothetical protein